jgi:DNA-binding NarL/FixJ family response regulator
MSSDMALTEREVEVLRLAATGATNKAIADALYLSENTVKSHLYHIYDKLEVHGRMQAVTEAARRGIIQI